MEQVKLTAKNRTYRIVEAGMMIAIAVVLSTFIKFSGIWANGGSITLCGMVPIILFAYRHGIKWGIMCGVSYGVLDMLLGLGGLRGISLGTFVAAIFLDYLIAFGVLGLSSIFKKVIKDQTLSVVCGTAFVIALRFVSHFFSGVFLWSVWAPEGMGAVLYSTMYNGSYLAPELLISCVALFILSKFGPKQLFSPTK